MSNTSASRAIILLAVLAVALSIVVALNFMALSGHVEDQAAGELRLVSYSIQSKIESLLEEAEYVLKAVDAATTLDADQLDQYSPFLRKIHEQADRFTILTLVDTDGFIVASSGRTERPIDVSMAPDVRSAIEEKKLAYGRFVIGPITGRPAIAVSQPVLDEDGQVRAILNGGLSIQELESYVESLARTEEQTIVVLNNQATALIAYPRNSIVPGSDLSENEFIRRVMDQGRSQGLVSVSGEQMLFGYTEFDEIPGGLHVVSYLPAAEARRVVRLRGVLLVVLQLLVISLAVLYAWWVGIRPADDGVRARPGSAAKKKKS